MGAPRTGAACGPAHGVRKCAMPKDHLRPRIPRPRGLASSSLPSSQPRRIVRICAGRVEVCALLDASPTSDRIWAALPLWGTAERWGNAVQFEVPVETGRDRHARALVTPGDICFWTENDRILIAFGPTPISRPGEIRLPSPCNVWAKAIGDVTLLKDVAAGEKVVMKAAEQ